MEDNPQGADTKEVRLSVVNKGWNLVSPNIELIFFIALGVIDLLTEAAGYRPFIRLRDLLLPDLPDTSDNAPQSNNIELTQANHTDTHEIFRKIFQGVEYMDRYTVHLTLATHILLPYPVITERQKALLVPWLFVIFLRSVVREMVISFLGIVVCASHQVFHYPCLLFSAQQGAQMCLFLYFWMSVHHFYYFLRDKQYPDVTNVINTIKRSSDVNDTLPLMQRSVERVLSVRTDDDDDDDNTDAALVERAAMAWIAREILESDTEYVTDTQFSQYLVVKATMELKQALTELAEKNRRKAKRDMSAKEKLEESLEFMKLPPREAALGYSRLRAPSRMKVFQTCTDMCCRDPIHRIRPLTADRKPVTSDLSLVPGLSNLSDDTVATSDSSDRAKKSSPMTSEDTSSSAKPSLVGQNSKKLSDETIMSAGSVDSSVQTEPPTLHMSTMLDILEYQQRQRSLKNMGHNAKRDSF